jgi:MFS family permease
MLQLVFCGLSASAFLLMYTQLPETSHPGTRGVDRALKAERVVAGVGDEDDYPQKWKWVWLNPFASLALLRAPNILAVVRTLLSFPADQSDLVLQAVAGSFALLTDFIMFVPSMYTFGKQYHIKNEAYVGLLFLSIGLGNMIGAPVAGRLSDWMVVRWRKRRGGVWVPEDRLRATLVGAGVFAPLSVLLSGIFTRFVPAPLGIILNVAVLFINGVGVDMTLAPSSAYFVDILHSRSAEVISATKFVSFFVILVRFTHGASSSLRAIFLTVITSGAIPAVERFGIVITNTTSAIVAWIGFA